MLARRSASSRPARQPALAGLVAHEIGLEPLRQLVLGDRIEQPVGHQRKGALGQLAALRIASAAPQLAQAAVQMEGLPQLARDEQRAPAPGLHGVLAWLGCAGGWVVGEQFIEARGVGRQQIDAAEVAEHALAVAGAAAGLALAESFLQTQIFAGWRRWRSGLGPYVGTWGTGVTHKYRLNNNEKKGL